MGVKTLRNSTLRGFATAYHMPVPPDPDPRTTGEFVRRIPGADGTLTVVGVVHDHPASTYRVRRVVEVADPQVLALELPPVAVPLFEQYARDHRTPPVFGGEMSAAIQAGDPERTLGIDRPSADFFRRLTGNLIRERPSPGLVRRVLVNAGSVTGHAIVCRVAAAVAALSGLRVEVDAPVSHDVDRSDPPDVQARDERERIRRARSFREATRGRAEGRASTVEDVTREEHMAERIATVEGDAVAVVGIGHLPALAGLLADPAE